MAVIDMTRELDKNRIWYDEFDKILTGVHHVVLNNPIDMFEME
jgi:hypothetical protein